MARRARTGDTVLVVAGGEGVKTTENKIHRHSWCGLTVALLSVPITCISSDGKRIEDELFF
jgi:hypothetical protein